MANRLESVVKEAFENKGWKVFTNGWPDMLCVKDDEIRCVEVKSETDHLRPNQIEVLNILSKVVTVRTAHPGPGYGDCLDSSETHLLIYPYSHMKETRFITKNATRNPRASQFEGLGIS